jgi:hypothetical protein
LDRRERRNGSSFSTQDAAAKPHCLEALIKRERCFLRAKTTFGSDRYDNLANDRSRLL